MRNRKRSDSDDDVPEVGVGVRPARFLTDFLPHDGESARDSLPPRSREFVRDMTPGDMAGYHLRSVISDDDGLDSSMLFQNLSEAQAILEVEAREVAREINAMIGNLADLRGPAVRIVEMLYGLDGSLQRKNGIDTASALKLSTDEFREIMASINARLKERGKRPNWFADAAARLLALQHTTGMSARQLLLNS